MKTFTYLLLVSTLALKSAYTKSPQYNIHHSNNFNAKRVHQQPQPTNANHNKSLLPSSSEKDSEIIHNNMELKADGTYHYGFETSNGIKRTEQGTLDGTIQGSSSYISPEGIEIKTTFVADENGYHPIGDHIPQVPDYIVRALEYIRDHPYIEKDYYTGEVKQTSFSNKNILTTTTKRSAYRKNNKPNKKKSGHNSKNNIRH